MVTAIVEIRVRHPVAPHPEDPHREDPHREDPHLGDSHQVVHYQVDYHPVDPHPVDYHPVDSHQVEPLDWVQGVQRGEGASPRVPGPLVAEILNQFEARAGYRDWKVLNLDS